MNKKIGIYAILVLMLISMASSVLAASVGEVGTAVQGAINYGVAATEPALKYFLGSYTATGDEFAIRVLALLLAILVVYGVLAATDLLKKRWLNVLVSAIIGVIGIRFMPAGFLQTLATPSSALVAAILFGLPFVIMFFLLKNMDALFRKIGWIVYAVIIAVLWIYNWSNPDIQKFNWIYPVFVVACLVMLWIDGTLYKWWFKGASVRSIERHKNDARNDIEITIKQKRAQLKDASDPQAEAINKDIVRLTKRMNEI